MGCALMNVRVSICRWQICIVVFMLLGGVAGVQAQEVPPADPRWDGTYRRIHVPILMYHYVSVPPEGADEYRVDLSLSPDIFRQHVDYFFYQGYTPISLYDLDRALLTGTTLPAKPVILTFDDGYADHYSTVFAALQTRNFGATFFVITGRVDANDPAYLTWEQIAEMSAAGMDMEMHTKTHPDLRNRSYDYLVYELLGSSESLGAYTPREPRMFAYPLGNYDEAVLSILQSMQVRRAVTTESGALHTSDNRLEVSRLRIRNTTGIAQLEALLQTR